MRNPDIEGQYGKAWKLKSDGPDAPPDWGATCAGFLVQRPGAHPFWDKWIVSGIHLRDMPGVAPANKKSPEMEHEFVIVTIDPECNPDPDSPVMKFLTPIDLTYQCAGLTDAQCAAIALLMVEHIVHGGASPDSDWRRWWKNSLDRTVKHYIEGVHGQAGETQQK